MIGDLLFKPNTYTRAVNMRKTGLFWCYCKVIHNLWYTLRQEALWKIG
jgi:hypothetical protein